MSIVRRETKPILKPSMQKEVDNMNDVLAQMRRSGRIYFLKSLPGSAIHKGQNPGNYAELTLPAKFIRENSEKIEKWTVLRSQLSCGRTSRPWVVRLRVAKSIAVCIGRGWHAFVTANRLRKGDSLIFLLKEDSKSEFEVRMFRGPEGFPYFPDEGENSPIDEEDEAEYVSDSEEEKSEQSRSPSPGRDPVEHHKAFPRTKHLEEHGKHPGFRKRLTASNIQGPKGVRNAVQFYLPRSFVKTHGHQLHGSVELQGIHEDSPTYWVTCCRIPQHGSKLYLCASEWSRFVSENRLKNGDELQFSLVEESYFVVRKV